MANKYVLGIDIGGSTTKIVGFDENKNLVAPMFVRAEDQLTSIYGAFGKFTSENGIDLSQIKKIMLTGVGSSFITSPLYNIDCETLVEFPCVGRGGLYLSGLDEAIVVSMGTGTAIVHAAKNGGDVKTEYLGGTGVGGGTMLGLTRKILGVDNIEHIEQLCETGNLGNVDLRIQDITDKKQYGGMDSTLTASNFGKLSDLANKNDIALGIANLVAETIGMMAIFAARSFGTRDIVLTGNLATVKSIHDRLLGMNQSFDVNFLIPEMAQYATVIGAGLHGIK